MPSTSPIPTLAGAHAVGTEHPHCLDWRWHTKWTPLPQMITCQKKTSICTASSKIGQSGSAIVLNADNAHATTARRREHFLKFFKRKIPVYGWSALRSDRTLAAPTPRWRAGGCSFRVCSKPAESPSRPIRLCRQVEGGRRPRRNGGPAEAISTPKGAPSWPIRLRRQVECRQRPRCDGPQARPQAATWIRIPLHLQSPPRSHKM